MATGAITVRGLSEVQRNLAAFPRTLVISCFSKALSRAAGVFEQELAARCPEAPLETTSAEEYGTLLDNLVSQVEIDINGRGGRASIGFGRKGFVALFVEYGHRMVTHKGKPVGNVAAHPFMRPAFDAAAERAVDAFIETVSDYLESGKLAA